MELNEKEEILNLDNNQSVSNESIDVLLKEIFIHKNIDNKEIYQPILSNSNKYGEKLKFILEMPSKKIKSDINLFQNYINNKIELFNKIKDIIGNSYEILDIIINFLSKNKINPIIYFIELYLDFILINDTNNDNELLLNIKNILIWFFSCGFMDKKYSDYVYQRLSRFQFEQNLNPKLFKDFLSLIEIMYGKDYNDLYKQNLIAKNYIYFYNKENSIIKTNISKSNNIFIKDGCSVIMWLYIKDDMTKGCRLCQMTLEKEKGQIHATIFVILNETFDLDVKVDIKGNQNLLKEQDNKTFKIQKNKWIQLKIQVMKLGVKLNVYQNYDIDKIKNKHKNIDEGGTPKIKFETKIFQTNNKKSINNNDLHFDLNNFNIIDLKFCINYIGLVGTIIFCKNNNPSESPINSQYGLKSNKISNFIEEIGLSELFFIFAPCLYMREKKKFIYSDNNITGELSFPNSFKEDDNNIDDNNIYKYSSYINNIYKIGGADNILPLFEIFYKFSKNFENKDSILDKLFIKLIKLLELIIVNKEKNYLNMYYNNNNFFSSLQLFLENIDEKYYQKDDNILLTLINIGKYVFEYCKSKSSSRSPTSGYYYLNDNLYHYFKYILFYPKIVIKFSLEQQNKLWNFFEEIKNIYKKKSKSENNPENYKFNISYYKQYFISFEQLNNFILLFNEKYPNEFLSPYLTSIIRNIFSDSATNDNERESLFLLINNANVGNLNINRLSDKIVISIIEIFIFYLDSNHKKYSSKNVNMSEILDNNLYYSPKMTVESFLSSPNYIIETLLSIFSSLNLSLKKVLINLLRVLSQKYGDLLKEYFDSIEAANKKAKKNKKIERITKDEFYYFIKENISFNSYNQKLRELRKYELDDSKDENDGNKIRIDTSERKSSMDSLNIIKNNIEEENNKINNEKSNITRNDKKGQRRSKSEEVKDINGIINQLYNNDNNIVSNGRKSYFNFEGIRISNPNNIKVQINRISTSTQKMEKINEKKRENEKKENKIKEKKNELEIQSTNCEISMILFDWLLTNSEKRDIIKKVSGNVSNLSNSNIEINTNSNFTDILIDFILKFLCTNKDLEVISKLLLLIMGLKGFNFSDKKNNLSSISDNYLKLLNYFSLTKTKFVQFLEELMINSYLCLYYIDAQNKFYFLEQTSPNGEVKTKNEYFKVIFDQTKELMIDIYFNETNLNKNNIIYEIINIILSLSNGLKNNNELDEEDIKIRDILFNFLKEFLNEISDVYISKLASYKKKLRKSSSNNINIKNNESSSSNNEKNERIHSKYKELHKNYLIFTFFIFEYTLLLINSNNYISKKFTEDTVKIKHYSGIPDFLVYEFDKNGNKKLASIKFDLYLKVYEDIMDFFNIEKLLKEIFPANDNKNKIELNEGNVFYFETKEINKLLKEFSNNKDLKSKLKEKLNLLFLSYKDNSKDFPLITLITILNNYYINNYIKSKSKEKINLQSKEEFDFMSFLDYHMQFILVVILISCSIKENENIKEKSYKEIQEIIYTNLFYNINNIISHYDTQYLITFIDIFTNILTLLSCLWVTDNEHKSIFHLGKNITKSAVKRLLNYYTNSSFFDINQLEKFSKQKISENKKMIMEGMNNIYNILFRSNTDEKNENYPNEDFFDITKYEQIYISRKYELNHELKIIINENSEKTDDNNENENDSYKNILYKIDTLKVIYDNNSLYNNCMDMIKRKNYRRIKRTLYSWNNSYSNINAFYKDMNSAHKKDDILLKYKISNYLSKDMTRKLLVPILDIDYYMPSFKLFKYKENLFRNNEESEINQYQNLYKIDLKIFDNQKFIINPEDENNYIIDNVCYIKTTHHIKGKLFIQKNKQSNNSKINNSFNNFISLSPKMSSLFFMESNSFDNDYLLKYCEDYDSVHSTCFGSIFKNNKNNKDSDTYLFFNFDDINFIFLRKYCFRNNSLELYLSNHRSYYFKFFDTKKRDKFLNELISILNQNNQKNKLFKPIKGIDENNKSVIIGYYRDEKNIKEYNSISSIRDLWKMNKISTLEYLMWVNIYGNRSFRDIAQNPVFPWLLTNYEYNTYEELSNNPEIRDFNLPMGMLGIDSKSRKRQDGYIETYKNMVMDLCDENLLNIKIKEEEENNEQNNNINNNKILRNTVINTNSTPINQDNSNNLPRSERNESVVLNYKTLPTLVEQNQNQNQEKFLPKIPDYKFDIEKLYYNLNFEFEKIPFCYGSHYSNPMYVSHYLVRLFPYSMTLIEIQGDGFDVSDRLFLKLQKSFYTAATEKCDLREIIPEFFTLPEMFLNINNLNLGQIDINYYRKGSEGNDNNLEEQKVDLNEVALPEWCQKSPYIFIEKYRKIFESTMININPWIDLIFGYTQRGLKAQKVGNLFLPYAYDGVMNFRFTKDILLNDRAENEFKMRFFEMGVNPCKVFEKKNKIIKNKPVNQIIEARNISAEITFPEIKLISKNDSSKKTLYINCYTNNEDDLFILGNDFSGQKINIQESKESKETDKNFIMKEIINYKEFPIKNNINKNIQNKLIIKSIYKNEIFVIAGFFDGSLLFYKLPNKMSKKEENQKAEEKNYYIIEENIIKVFDKSLITSLEIDKDEKHLLYGTLNGSIVIYTLNYNLYKENKKFIEFKKIFKSHNNYPIHSISINNDLNLFADCAYDGYVNIYKLSSYSNYEIVNSIYIDTSTYNYTLDYVFLSAQPLACIVLYSNDKCQFKCFSINGSSLHSTENDTLLTSNKFNEYYLDNEESMSSPIIFNDYKFNDYLIYIFRKNYVLIREFPSMKLVMALNPTRENRNEELTMLSLSSEQKNLFILEQNNNKIYIVNQKGFL